MRFSTRIGLVSTLVLASTLLPIAAQIRDYVPIVKAVYNRRPSPSSKSSAIR